MTAEIAAMLDELMGRNRNEESGNASDKVSFRDSEVCHFYLCGFCPHELFVNTRADLGPCKKIHDEAIRKEYQTSTDVFKLGYEELFFDFMQDCIIEVERRIKRNKQRLDQNKDEETVVNPETAETANRLSVLSIEITNVLLEIESLGEKGEVAMAMTKTAEVDKLKEERERIRLASKASQDPTTNSYTGLQEKQMEVCEICGSFLIVGDAQARVDDHLMGKQHMGYARIRAKIAELKDVFEKRRDKRRGSGTDKDEKKDKSDKDVKSEKDEASGADVKSEKTRDSTERRDSRTSERSSYSDRRGSRHDERRSSKYEDRTDSRRESKRDDRRDDRDRDRRSERRRSKDRRDRRDKSRDRDRRKRSRSRSRHKSERSRLSSKDSKEHRRDRGHENGRSGKENGERS